MEHSEALLIQLAALRALNDCRCFEGFQTQRNDQRSPIIAEHDCKQQTSPVIEQKETINDRPSALIPPHNLVEISCDIISQTHVEILLIPTSSQASNQPFFPTFQSAFFFVFADAALLVHQDLLDAWRLRFRDISQVQRNGKEE